MSSSIFLSYPRPFKKRQEEFIERIIHYFEERELQPRTLGVVLCQDLAQNKMRSSAS